MFSPSVAPLELMRMNPSMPQVAGMQLPSHRHKSLIAYRGQVSPERNKNTTDVNTITSIDDSLSVTAYWNIIPKNIEEKIKGTINRK